MILFDFELLKETNNKKKTDSQNKIKNYGFPLSRE